MACVYMHTVLANGKRYIGQCKGNPKQRWGSTGHRYKGQLFYYAIQKYGWANIKHEIIADNLTQDEADKLEKELIEKYNTTNKEFGYNITPGGKDGAGMPGGRNHNARSVICIETGEVWECSTYCANAIGVNLASLQESLYHGYSCRGNHFKYIDDDTYKINDYLKHVICIETGEHWNSAKECSESTGISVKNVRRYCNGERKPKNGLTLKYCTV